jgi:hypothetical protein
MRQRFLMIVSVLAFLFVSSSGNALTFTFSFTGDDSFNDGFHVPISGTVTGIISGLADNAISSPTSVTLLSLPGAYSAAFYAPVDLLPPSILLGPSVAGGAFQVIGGVVTAAVFDFASEHSGSLSLNSILGAAFWTEATAITFANFTDVRFDLVAASTPLPAVGLPGLALVMAGLLAWRRRQTKIGCAA